MTKSGNVFCLSRCNGEGLLASSGLGPGVLLNIDNVQGNPRVKKCVSSAELRNVGLQHREVVGRWEGIRDACIVIVLGTRGCACACMVCALTLV